MHSSSDHYPELIVQSNGKTQIRYNIMEVTRENLDGSSRTSYDYDYVEIAGEVIRSKIINTVIATVHTPDAEISLINNELASPGTTAYTEYQALRTFAKQVADKVTKD